MTTPLREELANPQLIRPSYADVLTEQQRAQFWARVEKGGSAGCWSWLGPLNHQGYGLFYVTRGGRRVAHRVHRIAWELLRSLIPDGLTLDHLCRNRGCVNPDHLEPVTSRENVRRGIGPTAINRRKTHCPQGHAYTPENTRRKAKRGDLVERFCRECQRLRNERILASKACRVCGKPVQQWATWKKHRAHVKCVEQLQ